MTDRNFCQFWAIFFPFGTLTTWKRTQNFKIEKNTYRYYHFTHLSWMTIMMYGCWDMEHYRLFCHSGPFFALWTQKIKIFKKWKNAWRYFILQMCTINNSHMMYGSWNMECNRQNFLSFWTTFCPFTPLTTQKIKLLKKWKNCLEILSFYTGIP